VSYNTVLFDTQAEADAQLALDLAHYKSGCACPYHREKVTAWAVARERLDGKWAYEVCPGVDYGSQTIVAFDEADYA